jgi:hypothetical protein
MSIDSLRGKSPSKSIKDLILALALLNIALIDSLGSSAFRGMFKS